MSNLRKILKGMEKRYAVYTALSPVSMIGEVLLETYIPLVMAKIIDVGIANRDLPYVLRTGIFMVCCALFSLLCGALCARFAACASQGFSHNLRRRIFSKIQNFSFANIDKFSTASLITRLTTDVTNIQNVYQMMIRMCVRSPFMLIAGSFMAFSINADLSLIFLVAIPILAIAILSVSTTAHPRFEKMMKKYDVLNARVQENLVGIRVVKAFVRGEYEEEKFKNAAQDLQKAQIHAEKLIIFLTPIMQVVMYVSIIATMWFGGNKVISTEMTTGQLISFFTYIAQVLSSLMMLGMVFVSLLDEESDVTNPENPIMNVKDGSICFENVDFSYNKREDNCVLTDVNLKIESGQVVGIIGGTGSSKTTLIQLIPRLYDATIGEVRVGGVDVRKYDLDVLRNQVSMVLQKNVLFSGTIKDNLRWGNKDATDEDMISVCKLAQAHDFILGFTSGYDTYIEQGGTNVSGGQKQRLCIARALLKKPKILILDDSTSAVDTKTDALIRKALKDEIPSTTKLIIAQRISSIIEADKIVLLDGGKIIAVGKHEELLKYNAVYKDIYESQNKSLKKGSE